jgi:hypothetical protein
MEDRCRQASGSRWEYPNHLARKEELDAVVATEELIKSVSVPILETIQGMLKQCFSKEYFGKESLRAH